LHLIVGVDPGTTTGLASVDLKGRVVDLFSSKDLGIDKAIEHLVSLGSVSVIATDVAPAPGFVLKMASKLGAIVYAPPESALVLDKIALTRSHRTDDAHQRDSLAAALIAYGAYRNKFAKIDSLGMDPSKADEVKHLFVRGYSIDKARSLIEQRNRVQQANGDAGAPERVFARVGRPEGLRDRIA
jgi:predicted RNase H-like nuclease (RuvC/YqgF family)